MQAGRVQGPRGAPTGPARWVLGFMKYGNQHEPAGGESRVYRRYIERYRWNIWETQKEKESFVLVWGLRVLIEDCDVVHVASQASRNQSE